jgi:hypothetical protein
MPKLEADVLIPDLLANSGAAGRVYMQYIVTHQDQVKAAMAKVQAMLTTRARLSADERFWAAGATTILTGMMIAKKMGLIRFDLTGLTEWAIKQIGMMRSDSEQSAVTDVAEHLGEMLNDFSPNFLVTSTRGDARSANMRAPIIHAPRGDLMGRVIHDEQKLLIPLPKVRAWCDIKQVDYRQMVDELTERGWLHVSPKPFALGAGTADYTTAPSRCLEVDLNKVQPIATVVAAARLGVVK